MRFYACIDDKHYGIKEQGSASSTLLKHRAPLHATDVLYHLDPGYERLEKKHSAGGIAIERVQDDAFAQPEPHTA